MPENPYQPPKEVNERSEILTPFLRAVGGFVLGTFGYAVLLAAALAIVVFLIVSALRLPGPDPSRIESDPGPNVSTQ
jgi:hypothetical protein